MASLQFIFCWSKHILSIIIEIFIVKHFSFNFWTADSLNMVHLSFFSFFKDLHIENILVANKYTKNIKWDWMMPQDVFFLESMKICYLQQKYYVKGDQKHNIWNQQHNSFPMRGYSSKSDKWSKN